MELKYKISAVDETSQSFKDVSQNLEEMQTALEESMKSTEGMDGDFDKVAESIKKANESLEKTKRNLKEIEKSFDDVNRKSGQMQTPSGGGGGKGIAFGAGVGVGALGFKAMDALGEVAQAYQQNIISQAQSTRVMGGEMYKKTEAGFGLGELATLRSMMAQETGLSGFEGKGRAGELDKQMRRMYDVYGIDKGVLAQSLSKMEKYTDDSNKVVRTITTGKEGTTLRGGIFGAAEFAGMNNAQMGLFFNAVTEGITEAAESGYETNAEGVTKAMSGIMGMGKEYKGALGVRTFQSLDQLLKSAGSLQGGAREGRVLQALQEQSIGEDGKPMSLVDMMRQAQKGLSDPKNFQAVYETLTKRFEGDSLILEAAKTFGTTIKQTEDLLNLGESGVYSEGEIEKAMTRGRERASEGAEEVAKVEEKQKRASDVVMDEVGEAAFDLYQQALDKVLSSAETLNKGWKVAEESLNELVVAIKENTDSQKSLPKELVDWAKRTISPKTDTSGLDDSQSAQSENPALDIILDR